jgi:hypothetical protein
LNMSLDAFSAKPCEKSQIIKYFTQMHGLQPIVRETIDKLSPNGLNVVYCSSHKKATSLMGFNPVYSSLETIDLECRHILSSATPMLGK